MKVISLNVGLPREVAWHDGIAITAIYKQPVEGRVALRKLNLDGDRQADLTVHGGEYKAVYCYPLAHYDYWRRELPGHELPMGVFGENFTTDDLLEDSVHPTVRSAVVTPMCEFYRRVNRELRCRLKFRIFERAAGVLAITRYLRRIGGVGAVLATVLLTARDAALARWMSAKAFLVVGHK